MVFDWDWAAAQAEFEKAAALHAAAGDYHSGLFALAELKAYRTGQFANVIEVALQAAARSPLDTGALVILGYLQYLGGHLEESAATYRRLLDLNSTYAGAQANYASILSSLGRDSEALAAAQQETDELARLGTFTCLYWTVSRRPESDAALRLFNEKFALASPYSVAQLHACRGEANAALDWLQRAYQRRDGSMMRLMVDPDFKDLRNDLRYQALLRKMKLAET